MIECMKIVKANQYHLLANYDRRHEISQSKPISSLSKLMIKRMKIGKANQYHLLANHVIDGMKIVKANQYHLLANYDRRHENSESKPISSLSKL